MRGEKEGPETGPGSHCRNCGSLHLSRHYEPAEVVCNDCGLVNEESIIDQGPEWRGFDNDSQQKRMRTGAPPSAFLADKGLSTDIGWGNRDTSGRSVPTQNRAQLYRMRKWQKRMRATDSSDRHLTFALGELERLASALELPRNVRHSAAILYRRAVSSNLIRGRTMDGMVAACIYGACRECNLPRTLNDIAQKTRIGRKEMGRVFRFMARELDLQMFPVPPQDYLKRLVADLKLSGETEKRASSILKDVTKSDLTNGCSPTGIAAATIYIACLQTGEKRTQKEVAAVARVTEVTIRSRYKCIIEKLKIAVPKQVGTGKHFPTQ